MATFAETIGDIIISLLKENLGDKYRAYYYGDPLEIPQSLLPCVIVEKEQSDFVVGPTGMDENRNRYVIKLAVNKKDEIGKAPDEVTGLRTLEEHIEAVDSSTGELFTGSVIGLLRKNFTLGNVVVDNTMSVRYGLQPRSEELTTIEGQIAADFKILRTVSSRV